MKNKKTLLAFFISLLVGMIGGTLAYYTNTTKYTNELKTAKYKTTTVESTTTPITLAAGGEFDKTINTTNEGTIPVAVRASYTEQWYDADGNKITVDGATTININNGSWASEGNYYYYKYILEPGDTTKPLIRSVEFSKDLGSATCTTNNLKQTCVFEDGRKYELSVGVATLNTSKYKNAWSTNVDVVAYTNPITYVTRQNAGKITTGDLIKVGTEEFYVVSSDEDTTVLLAHYNLNVGDNSNPNVTEGIQHETVKGWLSSGSIYGTLVFSSTDYWNGKVGTTESYTYQGSYSNPNYPYIYDSNSNLYPYIENYKIILETARLDVNKGRLLTYQEVTTLGCKYTGDWTACSGAPAFVKETSYWLGSAFNSSNAWAVASSGNFFDYIYNIDSVRGLRPVIEISTSDLK